MNAVDLTSYLEIVDTFENLPTPGDFTQSCHKAATLLGFEKFLFGSYLPQLGRLVIINGFPDAWRERYDENNYIDIDPTVTHCFTQTTPLRWTDIRVDNTVAGKAVGNMMEEANSFGLKDGVSVPVHGPGAECGMMSFVSDSHVDANPVNESLMKLAAQTIHVKIKAISVEKSVEEKTLTTRESACLRLTAAGKTSWEVSQILGVSESTVIFHLKNAIKKMGVCNRAQAVAKAVSLAKIKLF